MWSVETYVTLVDPVSGVCECAMNIHDFLIKHRGKKEVSSAGRQVIYTHWFYNTAYILQLQLLVVSEVIIKQATKNKNLARSP